MMKLKKQDTLIETLNLLIADGYKEDFRAGQNAIQALRSKKSYPPEMLHIVKAFRFEGFSNPSDNSELFALQATDGTKGTLVMSYGAKQSQNINLIKQFKKKKGEQ